MSEENTHANQSQPDDEPGRQAATAEGQAQYLETEINILRPGTPYMRDHLRIIWTGFFVWLGTTFGPVTLTFLLPATMTQTVPGIGFPLHYLLIAVGSPSAALLLSAWYARKRDQLDRKYGIDHAATATRGQTESVAADGGTDR